MLILDRVFWFINSAVTVAIVVIVALMLLRLIASLANPNPFGWSSQTIRRLTDPLIGPVRRMCVKQTNPKIAFKFIQFAEESAECDRAGWQ